MMNKKIISSTTKTDCLLYDKNRCYCKGLKELYCAKGEQCNFYKQKGGADNDR